MRKVLALFTLAILIGVAPARAEFLQMDLSIFGMD